MFSIKVKDLEMKGNADLGELGKQIVRLVRLAADAIEREAGKAEPSETAPQRDR